MRKIITSVLCLSIAISFVFAPLISVAKDISFSELVEILISVGAIAPEKISQARAIASQFAETSPVQSAVSTTMYTASSTFSFTKNLTENLNSPEVLVLQRILNADPSTQIATYGVGSPGKESTIFGPATKAALLKFQKKYNVAETGVTDASTRALLNSALIAQRINSLPSNSKPKIIVKANGQAGNVNIQPSSQILLSWDTANVIDCKSPYGARAVSGSQVVVNPSTGVYTLTCDSAYGPVTGYVSVNVATTTSNLVLNTTSNPITYTNQGTSWNNSMDPTFRRYPTYTPSTVAISWPTTTNSYQNTQVNGGMNLNSTNIPSTTTVSSILDLTSGNRSYVYVPASETLNIDNALTIEMWIKPTAWTGVENLYTKGISGNTYNYELTINNGKIGFSNFNAIITTASQMVSLNEWTHVAVVVDESSTNGVTFYINGSKVDGTQVTGDCGNEVKLSTSTNYSNTTVSMNATSSKIIGAFNKSSWISATSSPVYLGGTQTGGQFIGYMDDVRVWNRVKSGSTIKNNALKLDSDTVSGLVARWDFENFARDASGNGHNGTLNGSAKILSKQTITVPDLAHSTYADSYYLQAPFNQCFDTVLYASTTMATTTPPDGPPIPFGGQVTGIVECKNGGGGGEKLYAVFIKSCSPGAMIGTSKAGYPVTGSGYITFRENNPPLPGIGDSILGGEVPDESGKCQFDDKTVSAAKASNMISGGDFSIDAPWIGDASGPLGTGPACDGTATTTPNLLMVGGGSSGGNSLFVDTRNGAESGAKTGAIIGAIGGSVVPGAGTIIGGAFGSEVGGVIGGVAGGVEHVFGW